MKTKLRRPFDMASFAKRHIALQLGYMGSNYCGFALQKHNDNTVEFELFSALRKCRLVDDIDAANYSRCGRTDKGVSALGQVISVTVRSLLDFDNLPEANRFRSEAQDNGGVETKRGKKDEIDYCWVLNSVLPKDIFVLGWADCPSTDYRARFNARSRTYRYFFIKRKLDIGLMREAAELLVGQHDFRNFCKIDVMNVKNFVRNLTRVDFVKADDSVENHNSLFYFELEGNAFLWHQVRCIMSVLFIVGRKLEPPSIVSDLLDIGKIPGRPLYSPASDQPLVLHSSKYPNLHFQYNYNSLQKLFNAFERRKMELQIELGLVQNVLDDIDTLKMKDNTGNEVEFGKSDQKEHILCDYDEACCDLKSYTGKRNLLIKSAKEYRCFEKRKKCGSYEERVKNLSAKKKQKVFEVHGWKLD